MTKAQTLQIEGESPPKSYLIAEFPRNCLRFPGISGNSGGVEVYAIRQQGGGSLGYGLR